MKTSSADLSKTALCAFHVSGEKVDLIADGVLEEELPEDANN